ncbi:flagellar assembly peptidoglycan hydrolase FlgJ [Catenovulum sp. SM1970]|uniref:flagellar assembly peptidoglycan hydrolase FlgJ n=1 Tax=Marinifaba aquimaris TaxID=2741323 RepID=UPI001572ABAF|nr:flagellar assembly peptidoglycan hydrolase FlgJ [Marinifaba aquimaris]NTS75396.1 flagellar assembly peptidoglycan hydrolase FlgJ [Marinifaba aquimaris]
MVNQLEQVSNVHDLAGLDNLRQAALKNDKGALKQAAQQFESIFMNMLLKSMRQAEDVLADENSPFNSQTTKFYRDMQDQQMASELSKSGALGLADIIVDQLSPEKGKYMPADTLRADLFNPDLNKQDKAHTQPLSGLLAYGEMEKNAVMQMAAEKLKQLHSAENNQPEEQKAFNQQTEKQDEELVAQAQKGASFTDKQDFVQTLMPIAEKVSKTIGLPAVAMVAQAALETGWGQRMIKRENGDSANNFFGIKADNRWSGESAQVNTSEFKFGQMVTEKADFRAYDDIEQGLADYVSFIKDQPRYQKAVSVADKPEQYFEQLQQAGYATDPNYAKKIMSVLKDAIFGAKSAY